MIKQIFSIYDQKAEAFYQPFFFDTIGQAKRIIHDFVKTEDHAFNKHPADYTLFSLGTFDDNNGEIDHTKQIICSLVELKLPEEQLEPKMEIVK